VARTLLHPIADITPSSHSATAVALVLPRTWPARCCIRLRTSPHPPILQQRSLLCYRARGPHAAASDCGHHPILLRTNYATLWLAVIEITHGARGRSKPRSRSSHAYSALFLIHATCPPPRGISLRNHTPLPLTTVTATYSGPDFPISAQHAQHAQHGYSKGHATTTSTRLPPLLTPSVS